MADKDEKPKEEAEEPGILPKGVVESALFSAGRPLELEEIVDATGLTRRDIRRALDQLMKDYRERDTALLVAKTGEKFAMALKADYAEHARKLAEMEVPIKTLKTAALIAFHQPIKQSELQDMVGSKVYDHVAELKELGLVKSKAHERTRLLSTTERFAEYFGIDTLEPAEIRRWLAEKTGIRLEKEGETLDDYGNSGKDGASGEGDNGGGNEDNADGDNRGEESGERGDGEDT